MKPVQTIVLSILLAWALFVLTGCAHAPVKRPSVPSAAFVSAEKAKTHIEKAKVVAAKMADPEAKRIEETLDMAEEELDGLTTKLITIQDQMKDLAEAKEQSDAKLLKEQAAASYWRWVSFKLCIVAGLLGLWIFRRPIMALFGAPIGL